MSISRVSLRIGGASLALAAGLAFPAAAQSTEPPADVADAQASPAGETQAGQEIVITGSRIRRDPLNQDSPIVFVDDTDIAKTGLNSVNDVLQRLPSSGGGLNGKFNNSGNFGNPPDGGGVGAGAAEIDLRYLGSKRTLVLVDGLRFVNATSASGVPGSVDLNAIPEAMIERIEVLQDGASAIYGSDAIAGVVNIITKQRQKGLEARAQLGTYDDGDGQSQNYQLSWGNGEGPTQLVVGANFVKQNPISSGDRAISLFPNPYSTSCTEGGCSSGTPLGRFIVFPSVDPREDLTLIQALPPGTIPTIANFRPFAADGSDRFNFAPFNFILTPLKRYGAFANVRQEFGNDINLSGKIVWNRRDSKNQAAPLPLFVGPDGGNGNLLDRISIDVTNPFNPFGVTLESGFNLDGTPNGNTANYAFIGRRVVEGGPRRYNQTVKTLYGTATLDGKFGLLGRNWYWDVNGLYGRNKANQTVFGNINAANLAQALGPVANCTGACVPFNIFGGAGSITQAMLDYVSFTQRDSSRQKLWGVSANLSGSLLSLPGGDLGVAIGYEHRDYSGRFDPDPTVAAGLGSDIPALPTKGGYNVDELYAELNAPIVADRPFFELLELNGAVRYSDYSRSGSTTTFKGGVNWKPVADLRLRASYSEGFRAPTIGELFGTPSRFDQELNDPCSADQNPTGQIAANCATLGVPAGYQQNNPQLSVLTSGNEDLKPETSKGWNVGAVYSPSFIPRFSVEGNYYRIKIKDAIFAAAGEILARCVASLDPVACAAVTRTATGQIAQISGVLGNVNSIKTDGLDLNVTYRTPKANWGTLGFTLNNTFLFNYDVIVPTADGTATIDREGTEQGSPDQAFPKHKAIGILDWDGEHFGVSLTGRYIKSVTESQNGNKLNSRLYTDLQLRWSGIDEDRFGFAVGVNNLFDKDPPGCISCGLNNYDPGTYDVPGRYLYARATVKM
ncbi:TonB-dependent receptor [Sphingomonas arenae]|uniref:TonB-dependent receptor n=1 Tax=Sphingomonas arenae TaxID=2812555 RepID=UPI001967FF58|nr:TonB-dependent receptor [Sphingomonas arenae]